MRLGAVRIGIVAIALVSLGRARDDEQDVARRTTAPPAHELDAGRLRAAYLDLLGRPPFAAERERWLGCGLRELMDHLFERRELWESWLEEQLYYFLLIDNFRPHSERVRELPEDLRSGRLHVRDAIHRIALSSSFDLRNPGADTFVTVVMEQLLDLTVQKHRRELEIGKALYDGDSGRFLGQTGSSQADVIAIAIEDRRFATTFVEREYRRFLRAEPPRRELARWARDLREDPYTYTELVREWMLSEAYAERLERPAPQPNRMFVKALFVDVMDRLPDPEEMRRLRTALDGLSDPAPLRSVLARLLVDSGRARLPKKEEIENPTEWVAALFERLLGRSASQAELKAFVGSFHEPACRPETIVYALLSHPEYQHY